MVIYIVVFTPFKYILTKNNVIVNNMIRYQITKKISDFDVFLSFNLT